MKKREIVKPVIEKKQKPEPVKTVIKPADVPIPVPEEEKEEIPEAVEKEVVLPPVEEKIEETPMPVTETADVDSSLLPIETEFGAAVAPSFLHREMPVYPTYARRIGMEGKTVLKLTIDERGNLLNVEVVERAGYGFTESAVDAIKKSTFLPAKKNGKRIASKALLPVRFTLRRSR
jgi:protein TonB